MDWVEPQRRIYAEGETSMGCIDLDGTTSNLPEVDGPYLVNHIKKSDFVDGPECFVDRIMNANICPLSKYQQLTTHIRGINSPTSEIRHFLMQNHHVIKNNEADWITMVTASPGTAKTMSTNLVTFLANETYLVTSPPGTEVYPKYDVTLSSATQSDWIHVAICLKGGKPSKVQQQYTFERNDVFKQLISKNENAVIKIHPEIKKLVEYTSLEDFRNCEPPCWFFSESDSWIHLKLIERADRKINGTVFGELINEEQNFAYDENAYFDCSPEFGCSKIFFEVDKTNARSDYECPIFEWKTNESKIDLCTTCNSHTDCGSWDVNHMKCQNQKCICGDNWLPNQYNRCRILNNLPRPNEEYNQFYPSMCEDVKSCDQMLDECIIYCETNQDCIHSCLRDHADCSSN